MTIVYRRGVEDMKASAYERELAQTNGVTIRPWARPIGARRPRRRGLSGVVFERTRLEGGKLVADGAPFRLEADVVFTAIGQTGRGRSIFGAGAAEDAGRQASSSTTSGARACQACGRAAIASSAGSI